MLCWIAEIWSFVKTGPEPPPRSTQRCTVSLRSLLRSPHLSWASTIVRRASAASAQLSKRRGVAFAVVVDGLASNAPHEVHAWLMAILHCAPATGRSRQGQTDILPHVVPCDCLIPAAREAQVGAHRCHGLVVGGNNHSVGACGATLVCPSRAPTGFARSGSCPCCCWPASTTCVWHDPLPADTT